MRVYLRYVLVAILLVGVAQASKFESALDLIMRYHGKDSQGLSNTLDSLTQIATKLRDEPEDPRYRSIRILNKTFWERVGSVNGGISFMSALGFDLVEQGACWLVYRTLSIKRSSLLPTARRIGSTDSTSATTAIIPGERADELTPPNIMLS